MTVIAQSDWPPQVELNRWRAKAGPLCHRRPCVKGR